MICHNALPSHGLRPINRTSGSIDPPMPPPVTTHIEIPLGSGESPATRHSRRPSTRGTGAVHRAIPYWLKQSASARLVSFVGIFCLSSENLHVLTVFQ